MMKRAIVLVTAAILLSAASVFADTIILKSGEQFEGIILERTGDSMEVDVDGIQSAYSLDEVDSINGEEPVVFSPQLAPDISIEVEPPAEAAGVEELAVVVPEEVQAPQPQPVAQTPPITVKPEPEPAKKSIVPAVSIWVALAILLLILSLYIYSSLCIYFIAKKTDTAPAWLAWIPVANVFLMCKIASLSYWWILILLLSLLRYVGAFVSVGFFGFLWYRIALARNKPGWVGILAVVPVLNLFIYGYLAFSDSGASSLRSVSLPPDQSKTTTPPQPPSPPA
ncbi:MAG: hypothetical protein V1828_00725 [Candidatus Omnitrophota bacterium]